MLRRLLLASICLLYSLCARSAELIVSAAASLTNAFRDVGKLFEEKNPGHKAVFNFASSDVLLSQIAKGAPVDVFATADVESMDRAQKQNLLAPGTRRILLQNKLVLIAPSTSSTALSDLSSLEDTAVRRIAIGNPASVPVGRYSREAMEKVGLWSMLERKLIMAQNVRQALDYVARGEVDAGLVYTTDAVVMMGKVRVAAEIPTSRPIVYPVAIINDTRNRALADAFLHTLGSSQARGIFTRYGFTPS